MALALDRRWQRFTDTDYRCPCCGKAVQGVLDVGYDHPDAWPHASYRKNGGTVTVGQDRLTADLCWSGNRFYVRGLLALPIRGTDATFAFGPWAEVSSPTFEAYRAVFGTPAEAALGASPAHLANALPGFPDSAGLPLMIRFAGGTDRPQFTVSEPSHLNAAQRDGIGFDDLLDIYATFGHDLRPHLGEA